MPDAPPDPSGSTDIAESTERDGSTRSTDEELLIDLSATPSGLRGAVEAVLMVAEDPITATQLADVIGVSPSDVLDSLEQLSHEYDGQGRGFQLRSVGEGWRIFSRVEYAPIVEQLIIGGQQARLTQAALETLAVIAYRQPISRARISVVRGVSVDGVIRTLLTRGLVEEAGTNDQTGAMLYRTTEMFLERMGLSSLADLPALAPYLPEADVLDELAQQGLS
ncbi:MAG: SMC-Scp complex subunit ScpB [Actinomycetota bacterium]